MRLTFNGSWRYCIQMWGWIARQIKKGRLDNNTNVVDLKEEWIENHPRFKGIHCECFFCEYDFKSARGSNNYGLGADCPNCPGKLVSKWFHCMYRGSYHYQHKPMQFYRKLLKLNKKRKSKK